MKIQAIRHQKNDTLHLYFWSLTSKTKMKINILKKVFNTAPVWRKNPWEHVSLLILKLPMEFKSISNWFYKIWFLNEGKQHIKGSSLSSRRQDSGYQRKLGRLIVGRIKCNTCSSWNNTKSSFYTSSRTSKTHSTDWIGFFLQTLKKKDQRQKQNKKPNQKNYLITWAWPTS